ncbi:MAG: hypothetical protein WB554_08080, partial [Desulfomonilaceae bacterium]
YGTGTACGLLRRANRLRFSSVRLLGYSSIFALCLSTISIRGLEPLALNMQTYGVQRKSQPVAQVLPAQQVTFMVLAARLQH